MLIRFGVPRKLLFIIGQFHDGLRVHVRLDDGECSGWFSVDQGLDQECVLPSLLFIIYVAAVISAVYKQLNADDAVRGDLVRIDQMGGDGEPCSC